MHKKSILLSLALIVAPIAIHAQQTISTVAGNGSIGYSGDGGPATNAQFAYGARNLAVDSSGNIFIADNGSNRVREVIRGTGMIQTIVGNGIAGFSGDGGPATNAEISGPESVFVDLLGNLFIGDAGNARIREVIHGTGIIQTVAGSGVRGFSGDGGLAVSAELDVPSAIYVDGTENIYFVDNNRIREIVHATGIIQTVGGNGAFTYNGDGQPAASASFWGPLALFVDAVGNIFIADSGNNRIREISRATGLVQTIAGNGSAHGGDGGPATSAGLSLPSGVYVDGDGNVFIGDCGNSRVREVANPGGIIRTIAGNGTQGFSGDGGPATSAELNCPSAVSPDPFGNLVFMDANTPRVRMISGVFPVCSSPPTFAEVVANGVAQPTVSPGDIMTSFQPGCGKTLEEAAQLGGYDHFNWVQVITQHDGLAKCEATDPLWPYLNPISPFCLEAAWLLTYSATFPIVPFLIPLLLVMLIR